MIATGLLCVGLAACNTNENDSFTQETADTPQPMSVEYTADSAEKNQFTFKTFDLEVDYVDRVSYEVEFNQTKNNIKASIKDLDQQKVTGEKAYNQLSPRFQEMSFDEDSTEEEVIEEVIEILDLNPTYKEFELDITYKNGIEKEYEN